MRQYFAISSRLPVYRDGLFGRGMIAVSEQGRARFDQFPDLVADDLFLDSQFATAEKVRSTRSRPLSRHRCAPATSSGAWCGYAGATQRCARPAEPEQVRLRHS